MIVSLKSRWDAGFKLTCVSEWHGTVGGGRHQAGPGLSCSRTSSSTYMLSTSVSRWQDDNIHLCQELAEPSYATQHRSAGVYYISGLGRKASPSTVCMASTPGVCDKKIWLVADTGCTELPAVGGCTIIGWHHAALASPWHQHGRGQM